MKFVVDDKQLRQIVEDYFFDNNLEAGDPSDLSQSIIDTCRSFIYCKNCKFYDTTPDGIHLCSMHSKLTNAENFCSDAEAIEE